MYWAVVRNAGANEVRADDVASGTVRAFDRRSIIVRVIATGGLHGTKRGETRLGGQAEAGGQGSVFIYLVRPARPAQVLGPDGEGEE